MGKNVAEMEVAVANMFKKFGLMTNSGTSSLMLAAEVANLPKGSEVITAAFTFYYNCNTNPKKWIDPSFYGCR